MLKLANDRINAFYWRLCVMNKGYGLDDFNGET